MASPDTPADDPTVRRIEFDVDWPPGHVAAYLLETDEPVLVDAGGPGDVAEPALRSGLATHGYEIADIDHLVLTHGHPDHTGQVPTVLAAGNPTVYAPALTDDRLGRDRQALRAAVRANTTAAGTAPEKLDTAIEWAVMDVEFSRRLLPAASIDVHIETGEPFAAGGVTFHPVHTPGHNYEHHVYIVDGDERLAFTGDMAVRTFRAVLMHRGLDDGVREAVPAYERALSRLEDLTVDRVLPGHGPVHTEYGPALEQSRTSLADLLETTAAHLTDLDTAVEITRARLGDADSRSLGYMLPETVAALAHLDRTGRVTATVDDDGVRRYERLGQSASSDKDV